MTEYTPVSWSLEPVSIDKLQQMATNDQALYEIKPSMSFKHNGINRSKGMKILAGSALFQPTNLYNATPTIYFGNFFSAGCYPIIMVSIYSHPQTGMNLTPHGIGGIKLPDHRGFRCYVWADDRGGNSSTIVQPYYVTYAAFGF
jgi:hypothetical protein